MTDNITTPATFIPVHGLAFGAEDTEATMVTANNPLPVDSPISLQAINGTGYLASTGMQAAVSGDTAQIIIENPAASGKLIVIWQRWFDANQTTGTPVEYRAFVNPTATLGSSVPQANLRLGSSNTTVALTTFSVGTGLSMGGIAASSAPIALDGNRSVIELPVVINEGQKLGFQIDGGGQNIQQSIRVGITLLFYEVSL